MSLGILGLIVRIEHPAAKLITALRYRDVERAAKWLCAAFGFDLRTSIVVDDDRAGLVQLTYGGSLIMLLPVGGSELDSLMKQPDEIGGAETQTCYLVVDDVEAHHVRAQATGAEIISALKTFDNGGQGYTCRDVEGHLWSFGSYDPGAAPLVGQGSSTARLFSIGKHLSVSTLCAVLTGLVAVAAAGWIIVHTHATSSVEEVRLRLEMNAFKEKADQATDLAARHAVELAQEREAKEALRTTAQQATEQLARERIAKEATERLLLQRETEGVDERRAKTAAEKAAGIANDIASRERGLKEAAERAAEDLRKESTLAKADRAKAERTVQQAVEQLARERTAREAAERAVKEALDQLKQARSQGGVKSPTQSAIRASPAKKADSTSGAPASAPPLPPLIP